MGLDLALPLTAAASGIAWAQLAAWRAGQGKAPFAVRSLLGGAAAFALAVSAYDLSVLAGVNVRWETLERGDEGAVLLAAVIGLVEEGAKLAGLLLVIDRTFRRRTVLAAAIGVAAGFAALEGLAVLRGHASAAVLARAALAPVAHAVLALPLAAGTAIALRYRGGWLALAPALLASAALHAAGDLSLARPHVGPIGYAAALAAPAVALFLAEHARRAWRDRARLAPARVGAEVTASARLTPGRPS
jgi:RsiW-degrading membrane proteinase PrsW (M82 family)